MNDRKQWEHLNGLQLLLADLMANKDLNNNGLSKMLDEVRCNDAPIGNHFYYRKSFFVGVQFGIVQYA